MGSFTLVLKVGGNAEVAQFLKQEDPTPFALYLDVFVVKGSDYVGIVAANSRKAAKSLFVQRHNVYEPDVDSVRKREFLCNTFTGEERVLDFVHSRDYPYLMRGYRSRKRYYPSLTGMQAQTKILVPSGEGFVERACMSVAKWRYLVSHGKKVSGLSKKVYVYSPEYEAFWGPAGFVSMDSTYASPFSDVVKGFDGCVPDEEHLMFVFEE